MMNDCPDPKEVSDFHFLQLRTLRIVKEDEHSPPIHSINAIASASKFGLFFVGVNKGFKVLQLEDVLKIDEDKENRSIEEKFPFAFVPCGTPVVLAVNASQSVLAVGVTGSVIHFYSLASFPGPNGVWQPFHSHPLPAELRDFIWNPVVESVFAFCLNDGSLHVHEISGTAVKSASDLQTANSLSVCWSPKGKQLVVGKKDGSFSQYKPNLALVSTVMPPSLEESPISVTSICWISNTVFAVVYVAADTPYLFIVSTPKGGPVTYTNYNDVCLGNCDGPDQKYLLHFEPSWGILVCASFDSIEIVVLGDMPNWVQWDLREDGKALLPGKDGATHAVGMTVMYSAQKQIVISESESYPPMPVIFFLTNNGLLVGFHMINTKAGESESYPPMPVIFFLTNNGLLVGFHMINTKAGAASLVYPPESLGFKKLSDGSGLQQMNVTQNISHPSVPQNPQNATMAVGMRKPSGDYPTPPMAKVLPNITSSRTEVNSSFSVKRVTADPSGGQSFVPISNKPEAFTSVVQDKTQLKMNQIISGVEKHNEVESSTANSYMTAIVSEIQNFMKELQELKQLQSTSPTMDDETNMASLKVFAMNMHNFQKDINETMKSISSDIYSLKNVLLESFVLVEEACSRDRRRNDHLYISMLKDRALDPITAKRMQKINQHHQYLSTQLQEVSDKLDQDWISIMSGKRNSLRNNSVISSSEAIYKTIVSNQKIIHNLRKKVEILMKKAEEKKLQNTIRADSWGKYHKRSTQDDLSKLADEFLQVKIAQKEEKGEPIVNKKLSLGSQNLLRDFLKHSNVTTVRPTVVYSPAQSRLLSNAVTSIDYTDASQTQDISPKQFTTPLPSEKEIFPSKSPSAEASSNIISTKGISPNVSAAHPYAPVCEPITPPSHETSPQLINKTFTNQTFSKEKYSGQDDRSNVSFSVVNSIPSSRMIQKDSAEKRSSSGVLSSMKSNEEAPKISFSTGVKPVSWGPPSVVTVSSSSNTLIAPKTISFMPKTAESISAVPSPVFQSGLPKIVSSASSVVPPIISQTLMPVKSSSVTSANTPFASLTSFVNSENSAAQSQPSVSQPSNSVFPVSSNNTFSFVQSVQKNTETVTSLSSAPTVQTPENVSSNKNLSDNQTGKSNPELLFQKTVENVVQPVLPQKDTVPTLSSTHSSENPIFSQNAVIKTVSFGAKSQIAQEPSRGFTEMPKITQVKSVTGSISTNEVTATSPNKENPTVTSSQINTRTLPILTPVSDSPVLKPIPVTTSVTVIEAASSVTTQQTNSTSAPPAPSVTSESVPSLSELSFSKTTSVTLPTPPPQTTSSVPATLFGQNTSAPPPPPPTSTETKTSDSAAPPSFGISPPAPLFGQAKSETSFFSGAKTDAPPAFGQTSPPQTSPFGQPASTTTFSSPGGFFSQTPNFGTPDASSAAVTSQSDFNNQSSTFSFGKPAFGQTSGSFGLAKSLFGQSSNTFTQAGTQSSFSFSQGSSGVFGQGAFMSGLGGKPSEENASKNVFGMSNAVKPTDSSNLFKNASSPSGFGVANSGSFASAGTFSSGGGSVAQSGFGSFQQSPGQQPGGFGAAPAFGSPPGFGTSAFGSTPAFGQGSPLTSMFGQQQVSSNFSNFANASSPTFGSLASQTGTPGFGSPPSGFGSPPAFGTSFGGQPSSFGSPSPPSSGSSAFTQWRN